MNMRVLTKCLDSWLIFFFFSKVKIQIKKRLIFTFSLYCFLSLSGYGLHCHRAVITLCKLIGIEDMYAKVDGSVNLLNITRALFHGLANQVRDYNSTITYKISLCTQWII